MRNWKTKVGVVVVVILIGACVGGTMYLNELEKQIAEQKKEQSAAEQIAHAQKTQAQLEAKIRNMKDAVLDRIRNGKHGNGGEAAGVIVEPGKLMYSFDARDSLVEKCRRENGWRNPECDSWGPYQFKLSTIQHYWHVIYQKDITEVDALMIALDEAKARELVEAIVFTVEGGIWNWSSTTGDEEFYREQIPLIRELEQIAITK